MAVLNPKFQCKSVDELIENLQIIQAGKTAVDEMGNDWFKQISAALINTSSLATFSEDWFKDFESLYKKRQSVKSMPAAYRSAKSVLKSAMKMAIPLLDNEGFPKGKTALEKEIKALKANNADTKTAFQKAKEHAKRIYELSATLTTEEHDDVIAVANGENINEW